MGARAIIVAFAAAAAAVAMVQLRGDAGAPQQMAPYYRASWDLASNAPDGRRARMFRRDSSTLDIVVEDGTCHPDAPLRETDPRRRLHRVRIRETRHRVFITVVMRAERQSPGLACAGVGLSFPLRVDLPHPVGRRAVIGNPDYSDTPIIVPAQDRDVQARLSRGYLAAAARRECEDTPTDVLAEKYDTRRHDDRGVARASARFAPRTARRVVYEACLEALSAKD